MTFYLTIIKSMVYVAERKQNLISIPKHDLLNVENYLILQLID